MQEHGRGETRRMAEAAGCQRSYLSQVVHGNAQLTPDHAHKLSVYFRLSARERDYFFVLLEHARAASAEYRQHLEERLKALKDEHENLSSRIERPIIESAPEQVRYFSSWHWSAIHLLTSIPQFQNASSIARKLFLPESFVLEILESLAERGLVKHEGNLWKYFSGETHLSRNSPLVALHHSNWRQRALLEAQMHPDKGIHYTQVQSMSREVYEKIREKIFKFIEQSVAEAGPSKEEELIAITLDCFKV